MRELHDQIPGPLTISDEVELHGTVTNEVTVVRGGRLVVYGMIAGDLVIEEGGVAEVRGMVTGSVRNRGAFRLAGLVSGLLRDEAGGRSAIAPEAIIAGKPTRTRSRRVEVIERTLNTDRRPTA